MGVGISDPNLSRTEARAVIEISQLLNFPIELLAGGADSSDPFVVGSSLAASFNTTVNSRL